MEDAVTRFDVVVIGAGMAGSASAVRAAELGGNVALLDAEQDPSAGGNTVISGGGVHISRLSLDADSARLKRRIMYAPVGNVREDLAELIATNAGRSLAWLTSQGVKFEEVAPGDLSSMLAPLRDLADLHAWRNRGPQLMLRRLQQVLVDSGGTILGSARARELTVDDGGALNGVVLATGQRIEATEVVIADGGYQANLSLRKRFIGPAADQLFLRATRNGQGDGLLMGEALGAQLSNVEHFYGHCMHRDVLHNDHLWPWPALDELLTDGAILVDAHGRRITDEGKGGVAAANVVARLDDPLSTFVVLDDCTWQAADELVWGHLATSRELVARGATVIRGHDLAEIARKTQIDQAALTTTLDEYNAAVRAGTSDNLAVPRTAKATPLEGPLLALPMVPAITHPMGGLVVDTAGHVLDQSGDAISGLFAAGAAATPPHGNYYGGIATALVQGIVAAESCIAHTASPSTATAEG
jgi:fumarate reductase flavoprotein subunit